MLICPVWFVKPNLDLFTGVVWKQIYATQKPVMVLGFGTRNSESAEYRFRDRLIGCPLDETTGLIMPLIEDFIKAVEARWLQLQQEFVSAEPFDMCIETIGSSYQSVTVGDGNQYLRDGWEDFRIYLVKKALSQFSTRVVRPTYSWESFRSVGGATHH